MVPAQRTPDIIVVMGVSGSGKSSVAQALSHAMGWEFAEGDGFHTEASIQKMRHGIPLNEQDRGPWLEAIGAWIDIKEARGQSAVVSCSALRRTYRDLLRRGRPHVRFLHVVASKAVLRDRIEHRSGHYMPSSLLASQLALLEPLAAREPGAQISSEGAPARVLELARQALRLPENPAV